MARRTRRIAVKLAVKWRRTGRLVDALALDVNEHGMFVRTDLDAQPEEMLPVSVMLPDGPLSMVVIARFVGRTCSGRGIGAEIFVIGEAERQRWVDYYVHLLEADELDEAPQPRLASQGAC